jgi:carboxylate-amine ligase
MATLGIEEEYMFLDAETLHPVNVGEPIISELLHGRRRSKFVSHEFLASQLERSTPILHTLGQAETDLVTFRRRLATAAERHGVLAAGVGTPFDSSGWPKITDDDRYHRVETEFRGLVTDHLISGTHVHVAIPDRATGVEALNRIRVWLPTLLALAGNSPYWHAADTGFDSWRAVHMRRWSTIGCPPVFVDDEDYERRIRRLVGVGGTYDTKTIWWNARLAELHPTLEVRVSDAQLDVGSTLLLAALVRGLVVTAMQDAVAGAPTPIIDPELLDAALWHAARDGISASLLDPVTLQLAPAREVVEAMFAHVSRALVEHGDSTRTRELLDRVLCDGTGASRQRNAMRNGGRGALRDLYARSLTAMG